MRYSVYIFFKDDFPKVYLLQFNKTVAAVIDAFRTTI